MISFYIFQQTITLSVPTQSYPCRTTSHLTFQPQPSCRTQYFHRKIFLSEQLPFFTTNFLIICDLTLQFPLKKSANIDINIYRYSLIQTAVFDPLIMQEKQMNRKPTKKMKSLKLLLNLILQDFKKSFGYRAKLAFRISISTLR